MAGRVLPSSRTLTRYVNALGKPAWRQYRDLREKYKGEGLTAREAVERAAIELKVEERYKEWRHRDEMKDAFGNGVPLTPTEQAAVIRGEEVLETGRAERIGDEEMSLPEQVKWAMKWVARQQNGDGPPKRFPCEGALFWYQSAIRDLRDFSRLLLRVEAPGGDPDNLYLQDSQYQFSEIEKQIKQAVAEVGPRLREIEAEWLDDSAGH